VKRPEDLRQTDFHKNHGGGLMQLYGGSPIAVLESLKSEALDSKQTERKPKDFWV